MRATPPVAVRPAVTRFWPATYPAAATSGHQRVTDILRRWPCSLRVPGGDARGVGGGARALGDDGEGVGQGDGPRRRPRSSKAPDFVPDYD